MLLAQMPTAQIPDLPAGPALDRVRGPVEIPPYEAWQIGVLAILGLLLLAFLAWGLTRWIRARRRRTTAIEPHHAALAELETAAAHTANDDERFAVLSSRALRRYFEARSGIPALEKTTLEFLNSLKDHPKLNAEASAALLEFMQHCDRVKFARASLSTAQRQSLTNSAQQLIQQFEQSDDEDPSATAAAPSPANKEAMRA
jgi:hypothetical protein